MQAKNSAVLELGPPIATQSPLADLLQPGRKRASDPEISPHASPLPGTLVGRIHGFTASGVPLVVFAGNPSAEPLPARRICPIAQADAGREAVLLFEDNDLGKPIILGLLQAPTPADGPSAQPQPVSVSLDGEQINLSAKNEIVLRCGKASITLTRAGKVLIRGAYLLSRSSGVNRIKGGSVQIN